PQAGQTRWLSFSSSQLGQGESSGALRRSWFARRMSRRDLDLRFLGTAMASRSGSGPEGPGVWVICGEDERGGAGITADAAATAPELAHERSRSALGWFVVDDLGQSPFPRGVGGFVVGAV